MKQYIIGFVVACALWVFVLYNTDMPDYKIYNCDMAEFHPDFPPKIREECRKLRSQSGMII